MADAMKLVPCEPTREMMIAAHDAFWEDENISLSATDAAKAYRVMVAASPPAREEAPAEGAGERLLPFSLGEEVCGFLHNIATLVEKRRLGDGDKAYMVTMSRAYATKLSALRNRTSEPEAGAIGQVNALYASGFGRMRCIEWAAGDMPEVGTKLYAHPAPATADKLRVAVEALEAARGHTQLTHVYAGIDVALATLNEQPQ